MKVPPLALALALVTFDAVIGIAHAETYPAVGNDVQQDRDTRRRAILENELATEKKARSDVNAEMAAAIKAQRPAEDVQRIAAQALAHTSNIESLQREIDGQGLNKPRSRRPAFVPQAEPASEAASNQAPAGVPYWDVYKRKQQQPEVVPEQDQDTEAQPGRAPQDGDKEADSGPAK